MFKRIVCFSLLFGLACALKQAHLANAFLQDPPGWGGPKVEVKPSVITFFLDDITTSIRVNNNVAPFQFPVADAGRWDKEKKMTLALYKGDVISFSGKNSQGFAGLLMKIQFYDAAGNEKVYLTDEKWYCNGKPALIVLANEGKDKVIPLRSSIPTTAKWIWADVGKSIQQEVRCSFKIPCD